MNTRVMKRFPQHCVQHTLSSPVGELIAIADDGALHGLLWPQDLDNATTHKAVDGMATVNKHPVIDATARQLGEYFAGKRKQFDLPLALNGTEFQQAVWRALQAIPYGETYSYQQQAIKLGDKNKVRAVGTANGANPLSIVVPCHRVIGKNNTPVSYTHLTLPTIYSV